MPQIIEEEKDSALLSHFPEHNALSPFAAQLNIIQIAQIVEENRRGKCSKRGNKSPYYQEMYFALLINYATESNILKGISFPKIMLAQKTNLQFKHAEILKSWYFMHHLPGQCHHLVVCTATLCSIPKSSPGTEL